MAIINHNKINMDINEGLIRGFSPEGFYKSSNSKDAGKDDFFSHKIACVPFQIAITGRNYNGCHSVSWGNCDLSDTFKFRGIKETDFTEETYEKAYGTDYGNDLSSRANNIEKEIVLEYFQEEYQIKAEVCYHFAKGAAAIRCFTRVTNESENDICLSHLSSAYLQGIAMNGLSKWYSKDRIKLHYCMNGWQAEGQWRQNSLEETGLYPASAYNIMNSVLLTSIGTFSTNKYLPFAVLEDLETGTSWYWQIENSSSWYFNIGFRCPADHPAGSLYLECGTCDERNLGWTKTLIPGQNFTTPVVAAGTTDGGFEESVRELTKYRRNCLYPTKSWQGEMPINFNDFMNSLWGQPTDRRLIPLIDAAAKAGAEMFCIDAGWFGDETPPFKYAFEYGDWIESKDRFGEYKLQGILDYIKSKNMIPGIWLEIEVCGNQSEMSKKDDSWFLMRNGKRIGGGTRYFLDFCNPEVVTHELNVIDGLYKRGIRYIKNDYNDDFGIGCDYSDGGSAGDGILTYIKGFYRFIELVHEKYPDLTIENCASGAMREDYGILSRFHLQSSSDQVIHTRYPSIINGALANVIPEQLGSWSYPFPIEIGYYDKPETIQTPEYLDRMKDCEETIFNMVTGFCGTLYLSGHIDYADENNFEMIRQGVEIYKNERAFIRNSFPFWPLGMKRINDTDTFLAQGLIDGDNKRALVAVWRRETVHSVIELELPQFKNRSIEARQYYPIAGKAHDVEFSVKGSKLVVKLPRQNSGRLFEIVVKD